ncbi:hypothetical protein [Streptomyces sp. NPDC000961]|uniref:hypothetical protein n=1 Tax=Streptomyces sp. NPDC000961 TaxID=3364541 RepID=UPI003685AD8E
MAAAISRPALNSKITIYGWSTRSVQAGQKLFPMLDEAQVEEAQCRLMSFIFGC